MITIIQSAMTLNAEDVPGPEYHMRNMWRVEKTSPPSHTLGCAGTVAKGAPGGKPETLVMNSHGSPAYLYMPWRRQALHQTNSR